MTKPFPPAAVIPSLFLATILIFGVTGTSADVRPELGVMQIAQAGAGATTGNAPDLQGIGLTPAHRRVIYEHAADERAQDVFDGRLEIGSTIADSVRLNEIPIPVKDQVGVLRDFKFAKLQGEQIVIVDPASRKIVDIVTKEEGR